MADDDLLLNFSVNDTPSISSVGGQYKGRWKERALSKKWDKIKARKALSGKPVPGPSCPQNSFPTTTAEIHRL